MADIEADAVVIGAGPCGAAAAWRLAAAGVRVALVDRGDWFDFGGIGRDRPDWETTRTGRLNSNPNLRRGRDDVPVDDSDSPIKPMLGNGVGGSSIYWTAHVPRFCPGDFRMRSEEGVGDDWPIDYADLEPYYELNEEHWGTAFVPGDPTIPRRRNRPLRLPTIGAHGARFARVLDELGWHWWPVDLVVGRDADDPGTVHCTHIGPCDVGCPSRQRSAADRAYVKDALAAGARLVTGARIKQLEHDARGRVVAAVAATVSGTVRIKGERFVLAASGMGTPRLLLLSASARFPHGLANGSGLVGRNLMLHPYARVYGLFDEALGGWVSGEKAGMVCFEFRETDRARGFVRGSKLQLVTAPAPAALATGNVIGARVPWGADHHRGFEARFDRICGFTVCAEDLAEPENRIALSDRLVDADGLPAPKMIYRVSDNSRRILDFGMDRAAEALQRAGARQLFRTPLRDQAGFHLMGTARMGNDPQRSVTDGFGRCHEVDNLFIADASLFVTSAATNPTATAQALALRAADHVIATRRV